VADAAVVGVPDGKWGEIIGAVIARAADAPELTPGSLEPTLLEPTLLDTTSLDTWLADRIAGYKRPRRYIVVDEVRRTSVDKVDYEWARATLSERLTS